MTLMTFLKITEEPLCDYLGEISVKGSDSGTRIPRFNYMIKVNEDHVTIENFLNPM